MYFKRIELQGFKSFAEHVSVEFQEGITCVVGPNGSGKSNISDAIKWVLGEQSPKALRGGKMEEVIFAGTASRKPKGMAEVTLVIDNSSGRLPIDYSEVAIRRRMYRSGESEYAINNNQCRLRDIKELIMDTGIGVDGYSIISQGKISEIVSSKPESRRELFEEAAGIIKYRTKKAESERKLENAAANLDRVDDIVEEIESRIDGLRDDSEKAKEYLILRDRYKELEINITLQNIENIQLKNEFIKDEISESAVRIDGLKDERVALDVELADTRARSEELEKDGNKSRDSLMEKMEEIHSAQNRSQVNEEKRAAIQRDRKRLTEEIEAINWKHEREKEQLAEYKEAQEKVLAELKEHQEILDEKLKIASSMTLALTEKNAQIDQMKNSIYDFHAERAAKESEAASIVNLHDTLERRKEQLHEEESATEIQEKELASRWNAAEQVRIAAVSSLKQLETERVALEVSYAEETRKEEQFSRTKQELQIQSEQLLARRRTIEEMESNYEGYQHGVKSVMKAGLSGITGVVAELMEVPSGLEVAIETALGGKMQNVICEDDESAKNAIRYLKEHKAGRITFLPVKSMKQATWGDDSHIRNEKGFLGIAADKVNCQDKYRNIYDYLLCRFGIVDNLENAIRISKKNTGGIKLVTLEGEVINESGAMTGGAFKNKSANLLERRSEIAQLTKTIEEIDKKRSEASSNYVAAQNAAADKLAKIRELERNYRETEMEKLTQEKETSAIENQRKELQTRLEKWTREIGSISEERSKSEEMTKLLHQEIQQLIEKSQDVTAKIDVAMEAYESEKKAVDALSEEITQTRVAVGSKESEKQNGDRMIERLDTEIRGLEEEKASKQRTLEDLDVQERELDPGHVDLGAFIREKEAEKTRIEQYIEEIQEMRSELLHKIEEMSSRKSKIEDELEKEQTIKYETEIRQARNDTQLDSLKSKLWDEFEVSYIQAIEFKKKEFSMNAAVKESREIRTRLKELGEVNVGAIKEYESVSERYTFLTEQREDLLSAMDSLKKIIEDMDKTIKTNFKASFDRIVDNFDETFKLLFGGGSGELRLEDENNPLECGIEINAQPPGKKLQNMNLLSGGEKTMTAIALMFAILKAKPTPFCILDEVEAALDDSNIHRFADYLANFKETQFTLVTHQKATMEYADALYGVTMPEQGISKVLSLKLGDSQTAEFAKQL